jgi:hypothetical protein
MQPKAGALGVRSMMIVSTPAPLMVRGKALAIDGRPFGPSVSLSTATKVSVSAASHHGRTAPPADG